MSRVSRVFWRLTGSAFAVLCVVSACQARQPVRVEPPGQPTLALQIGTATFDANVDMTKATLVPELGMGLVIASLRTFVIDLSTGADLRPVVLPPGRSLEASAWLSEARKVFAVETEGATQRVVEIRLSDGSLVGGTEFPPDLLSAELSPDLDLVAISGSHLLVVADSKFAVFDAVSQSFSTVIEAPIEDISGLERRVVGCPSQASAVFYEVEDRITTKEPEEPYPPTGLHLVLASGAVERLQVALAPPLASYEEATLSSFACDEGGYSLFVKPSSDGSPAILRGVRAGSELQLQEATPFPLDGSVIAAATTGEGRTVIVNDRGEMFLPSTTAPATSIDLDARDPTNLWLRRQNMYEPDRAERYDSDDIRVVDLGDDQVGVLFSGGYSVINVATSEVVAQSELQAPLGAITRFRLGLKDRAVFLNQFGVATLADLQTGQIAQAERDWAAFFEQSWAYSQPVDVAGEAGVAVIARADGTIQGLDLRNTVTTLIDLGDETSDTLCVSEDLSRIVLGVNGPDLDDRLMVYARTDGGFVLEAVSEMPFEDVSELVCDDRAATFVLWDSLPDDTLKVFAYADGKLDLFAQVEGEGGALTFSRDGRWLDNGERLYSVDRVMRRLQPAERPAGAMGVVIDESGPRFLNREGGWLETPTGGVPNRQILWADVLSTGRLMALSDDLVTRIYDPDRPHIDLLKLLWFREGGWAAVDRLGRFDASDLDNLPLIHWVFPDQAERGWSPQLFVREFFEPDLIRRTLQNEMTEDGPQLAAVERRVRPQVRIASVDVSKDRPDRASVVVELRPPGNDPAGNLTSAQLDAYDLRLLRNGRMVARYPEAAASGAVNPQGGGRISLSNGIAWLRFDDIPLPALESNEVTFSSYAFNYDRVKTETASLAVAVPPRATERPSAHIVAIGVNDYLAPGLDLNYAVSDAVMFADVLQISAEQAGRWASVSKTVLTASTGAAGVGAKKEDVLEAIARLGRRGETPATPDDLVFIFFAGHGVNDESGAFFLLPSDFSSASFDEAGHWRDSAISGDDLARALQDIDAREIILVIDACFSESSIADGRFKPAPLGDRGLGQVAYDKGMRILVSARANEAAIESGTIGHGLVTYALMHFGLRQARADRLPADGEVTLAEWLAYVQDISNEQFEGVVEEGWRFQATRRGFNIEPSEDEVFGELQKPRLFDFAARLGLQDEVIGRVIAGQGPRP